MCWDKHAEYEVSSEFDLEKYQQVSLCLAKNGLTRTYFDVFETSRILLDRDLYRQSLHTTCAKETIDAMDLIQDVTSVVQSYK